MAVRVIRARDTDPVVTAVQQSIIRAAAYCCVSTDSDEQETSYEVQVTPTHYTSFIQSHSGWELAGIFVDEGLSGTRATVTGVDDARNVMCVWDCGSSLSLAFGTDHAHKIRTENEAKVTLDWYGTKQPEKDCRCPRCGEIMWGQRLVMR